MSGQLNLDVRDQVRAEERSARARQRQADLAARKAERRRWREWCDRLAGVILETRTQSCRCELRATMTRGELEGLGAGCTDPHFVCPRLNTVRRRMGL